MQVIGSIKLNNTTSSSANRSYILGVAGGSGSGKTYFAKALNSILGEMSTIIYQDNFYHDQSHRFDHDGGSVNFDHPESLDLKLLADSLSVLRKGEDVYIPIYDFKTHSRLSEKLFVKASKIIIVDGILIYTHDYLRSQFDEMIFFDTPESLRFERRLERDVSERGRTPEGVKVQFEKQVKPMHDQFVAPTLSYADVVIRDLGDYAQHLDQFVKKLQNI